MGCELYFLRTLTSRAKQETVNHTVCFLNIIFMIFNAILHLVSDEIRTTQTRWVANSGISFFEKLMKNEVPYFLVHQLIITLPGTWTRFRSWETGTSRLSSKLHNVKVGQINIDINVG